MSGTLEIQGERNLQTMFAAAPDQFSKAMAHWLWGERKRFVGNKKIQGDFRRELRQNVRKDTGRPWSRGMGQAFTGKVFNQKNLEHMWLDMGVQDHWLKRIPALSILGKGGSITPRFRKWLIIPIYQNLRLVRLGRIGGSGKNTWAKIMQEMFNSSMLEQPFMWHGKLMFLGDVPGMKPAKGRSRQDRLRGRPVGRLHQRLLFVGVKSVRLQQKFDFVKSFEGTKRSILSRLDRRVSLTIDEFNKKKWWANGVEG